MLRDSWIVQLSIDNDELKKAMQSGILQRGYQSISSQGIHLNLIPA
jgi:hypothetical protein